MRRDSTETLLQSARATFASAGRAQSYLETIEATVGLPIRPTHAGRIEVTLDDCLHLGERLRSFYEVFPLSCCKLPADPGIVPIYTSDLSQNTQGVLSNIGRRFEEAAPAGAGRLANLFLYARSTVMSDDMLMLIAQIGNDTPGRPSDEAIVEAVQESLNALCHISDLVRSDTLTFYYPEAVWQTLFENLQDNLLDLLSPESYTVFREWVRSEVITDPDLERHADTFAEMAIMEMGESLGFCSILGLNAAPVLSGAKALRAYRQLITSASPDLARNLADPHETANLYSYSTVDLSQLPPQAFADLRFDSKAFTTWQTFLAESLAETREYEQAGKPFDEALRTSLQKRGRDFEARLHQEFGNTTLASAFQFTTTNAIGFLAGLAGSVLTGTTPLVALLTGTAALTIERLYSLLELNDRRALAAIIRKHYHAFLPATNAGE